MLEVWQWILCSALHNQALAYRQKWQSDQRENIVLMFKNVRVVGLIYLAFSNYIAYHTVSKFIYLCIYLLFLKRINSNTIQAYITIRCSTSNIKLLTSLHSFKVAIKHVDMSAFLKCSFFK